MFILNIFSNGQNDHSDSYSIKYKDYYQYRSLNNSYTYRFKLKNYANNVTWPLNSCPKCSCDLNNFPAHKVEYALTNKNTFFYITFMIMLGAAILYIAFMFKKNLALSLFCISILAAMLTIFLKLYKNTRPLELHYCSQCNALIYNYSPAEIISREPPSQFFKKLEQIPGFELE